MTSFSSFLFLIPLSAGAIAAYVYSHWADETAHIVGFGAVIGLVTALVLAPWQVQFLLLLAAIAIAQYLLRQRQAQLESLDSAGGNEARERAETEAEDDATPRASFVYRGVSYSDAPQDKGAGGRSGGRDPSGVRHGRYRGVAWESSTQEGANGDREAHASEDSRQDSPEGAAKKDPIKIVYRGSTAEIHHH